MSPTRREVLMQLAALAALPLPSLDTLTASDPLKGTMVAFQAGRKQRLWTSEQVTRQALERCRSEGARWRAIDALSPTAMDAARASALPFHTGQIRGSLAGVQVSATATPIGLPLSSPALWA